MNDDETAWLAAAEAEGRRLGVEMGTEIAKGLVGLVKAKVALLAQLATVTAERDDALWEAANLAGANIEVEEERDRLRAALATTRENVEAMVQAVGERYITEAAVCTILGALRARVAEPPAAPRQHWDRCQAETNHAHDCATATRLAQLTAFAEDIRDGWTHTCPQPGDPPPDPLTPEEHDPAPVECYPCLARRALEPPNGSAASAERCMARSSQGVTCGLAKGHDGDHKALGWGVRLP